MKKILLKYATKTGQATHTDMTGGKFHVPDDKLVEFHTEMSKHIVAGTPLHIVETHNGIEYFPVVIDIDLDYPINSKLKVSKLNDEKLKEIYVLFVRKMWKHFEAPETIKYHGYILVKPSPYVDKEKDRIRDGIHIIFPNIVTTSDFQDNLRKLILADLSQILEGLGHVNSIEEVYDPIIIRSQFVMYGNHKKDQKTYELKHIYCYNPKTKKVEEFLEQFNEKYPDPQKRALQLLNTLSIRNKNDRETRQRVEGVKGPTTKDRGSGQQSEIVRPNE